MKEQKFIGTLMPSHPDFQPIIQAMREKYKLHEPDPEGEPIREIYFGDDIIPLKDFHQEIRKLVDNTTCFLPEGLANVYLQTKDFVDKPIADNPELCSIPDNLKPSISALYVLAQSVIRPIIKIIDIHYGTITDMLYIYLLTGETEEIPADWISKVATVSIFGEPMVMAIANQISDPEVTVQQFRAQYKKTFGKHLPKVTKASVSTAYYLRLHRLGKPWDEILYQFIRNNKFRLPRDKNSPRYFEVLRKYDQRLRKRIQRSETILEILVEDKI
jgi:hypothetical protein